MLYSKDRLSTAAHRIASEMDQKMDQELGVRCWEKTVRKDDAHTTRGGWGCADNPFGPATLATAPVRKPQVCVVAKRRSEP